MHCSKCIFFQVTSISKYYFEQFPGNQKPMELVSTITRAGRGLKRESLNKVNQIINWIK